MPFDIRHRFVTSFVYELPWGAGRKYEPTGVVGALARDWSLNGILTLNSGLPFTVTSNERAGTGGGRYQRADCVGDPLPDGFDQTIDRWFDAAAFAVPAVNTYGSCGYNTLRGPSSKSMNLSVFRSIVFGERRVEFRIETFNLFNWVNFGFPAANVSNAGTIGRITSTLNDPREMQFAVKFYF